MDLTNTTYLDNLPDDLKKEDIDLLFARHWSMCQSEVWVSMNKMMLHILPRINDLNIIARIGYLADLYKSTNEEFQQNLENKLQHVSHFESFQLNIPCVNHNISKSFKKLV